MIEIKIIVPQVYVEAGTGDRYIRGAAAALGVFKAPALAQDDDPDSWPELAEPFTTNVFDAVLAKMTDAEVEAVAARSPSNTGAFDAPKTETAVREPGKPAPGRQRRTKAEIAEDETRDVADDTPAISTGGERINPADAADEASEAAQRDEDDEETPIEKLRRAMNRYAEIVGPADAIDKIKELLGGKNPIELADDEILAAIERVERAATEGNKQAASGSIMDDAPKAKSMDDWRAEIRAALLAYAQKFDKTTVMAQAKFAQEDGAKIFDMVWPGQTLTLSTLPDEPANLAKLVSALGKAIATNYFKR